MILDLLAIGFWAFELENDDGYDTSLDSLATISLIIEARMHQFYMNSVREETIFMLYQEVKVPLLLLMTRTKQLSVVSCSLVAVSYYC